MLNLSIALNRDIVGLIDMNWSTPEIANELQISEKRVDAVVAEYFNDMHESYLEQKWERHAEDLSNNNPFWQVEMREY